ncbi:receptor-type tyrosine-protein phosphatase V-like [Denticeps clupeoides]|uniref:receptor-type tyrosine-protein phosphatase V-like n=1 Tax=Denticeps clupeoides TaxID=299321 RepID=UPI0010A4F2B3|nr:receptor-type tyrosine-protein phosphatase V-like [Denticeps clupeoides]
MRGRTFSREHILQEFQQHCQELAANDNAGYKQQFEDLCDVGQEFSTRAGELDANKNKNRYPYILPYDHSRVRLSLLESILHSDYINASYVPGGSSARDFICTQGPLRNTMADFWRMVWEQNVHIIIMVTALRESGKVLCDQYWPPERGTGCYGNIQVTTATCKRCPESYITSIYLQQSGSSSRRKVTHYLYPGWPDQGVPHNLSSLGAFVEHVRQHMDNTQRLGPTVVHCSAGVGRSGSFVALLWLTQLCVRGILPDVKATVQDLRRHRVLMVQTLEQYICVHKCLLHWLGADNKDPQSRTQGAHLHTSVPQQSQPRSRSQNSRKSTRRAHQSETAHSHTQQPSQSILQALHTHLRVIHPSNLLRRMRPHSTNPQTSANTHQ